MKANFTGVTTARAQTESRSEWQRRDEARKREIARARDDKRTASLIMETMAGEIAELRKPKPMMVNPEAVVSVAYPHERLKGIWRHLTE